MNLTPLEGEGRHDEQSRIHLTPVTLDPDEDGTGETERHMDDGDTSGPGVPRSAEWSVALGVAGLACAVVPVVGDWVAAPLALASIGLGSFAIHVAERDARPGTARGLVGAMTGVVTLGVVLFSLAASIGHG